MSFEAMIGGILAREGGYVDHKNDRGGATNMGITQRVYADWLSRLGHAWADVRGLTRTEAEQIYHELYWRTAKCEQVPEAVRDIHFDAAVNHGVTRAAKLLQEAAGVEQDGVIGPVTLSAAEHDYTHVALRARYLVARYRFYGKIISRDRSQLTFIAGWMKRMEEFA